MGGLRAILGGLESSLVDLGQSWSCHGAIFRVSNLLRVPSAAVTELFSGFQIGCGFPLQLSPSYSQGFPPAFVCELEGAFRRLEVVWSSLEIM